VKLLFLLALLLVCQQAFAYEVLDMDIRHQEGKYLVDMEVLVDVPVAYAERSLLDFERLHELNGSIRNIKILSSTDPGTSRVQTEIHSCVWFRCVDLQRVEAVRRPRAGLIEAVTLPEFSDFRMGVSRWVLQSWGEQTHIDYHAAFAPTKGEVPVIGPLIVKSVIRREALMTYRNMEARYLRERGPCEVC
jgi:hypothetical protein